MADKCERCGGKPFTKKDRFCKECRKAMLIEMQAAGFLAPRLQHSGIGRTSEQRENVYETKHGTGHG